MVMVGICADLIKCYRIVLNIRPDRHLYGHLNIRGGYYVSKGGPLCGLRLRGCQTTRGPIFWRAGYLLLQWFRWQELPGNCESFYHLPSL